MNTSILAEYTSDTLIYGEVVAVDLIERTFKLVCLDGSTIKVPLVIVAPHIDTIMKALNNNVHGAKLRIRVSASGRFDQNQKLQDLESVQEVRILDPLDIRARVEELKLLQDGWLDGEGIAPSLALLQWVATLFETHYPGDIRLPYLFPTPEGFVVAEWALLPWSITLEFDEVNKPAAWHALNLDTDAESTEQLNLQSAEAWKWLSEQIRLKGGSGE